jgi:hypothetical protein
MSAHFKWYPGSEEVVIPWNARYPFPSQSNKAEKMTPRIPPKSGSSFAPGQIIRIEFPAQGYVNPINTTLEFDVTLYGTGVNGQSVRFQNNIQSIFSRVRLLYGATPLEDIINYNHIVRALTEWTATNSQGSLDQTSIAEGIGGYTIDKSGGDDSFFGNCNVRQKFIQGVAQTGNTPAAPSTAAHFTGGTSFGNVGNTDTPAGVNGNNTPGYTRRYQINLALGLFTQDKLIPVKFMASQLAIEITLEQATGCIFAPAGDSSTSGGVPPLTIPYIGSPLLAINPTYGVGNVNLIPEILQFDASYGIFYFT